MSGIFGKVVVITGASSGMGEATALYLAERGAKVVLGARREEVLKKLTNDIVQAGGEAIYAVCDVRKREHMIQIVKLACDQYGKIDVLVSSAGIMPISALDDLRVDDWDAMIDIHVKGLLHGIAAALPIFRKQHAGHFINIASTAAHRIVPNMAVYCGTKFAVRAISEGLRQEAGDKLRVTVICPGYTATNFAESVTDAKIRAELKLQAAKLEGGMPPEAIARAIAYAMEQPVGVDVGEIIIRPTAQG